MNMQDAPVDTPRLRILDHVRRKGAISRIDLSEQIGISPATVSVLCAELIENGLCRDAAETVMAPNRRGRPKTMLQLTPDAAYACGVKVSMHRIAVTVTDFCGEVVHARTQNVRAKDESAEKIADICADLVDGAIAYSEIDRERLAGVGFGVPGFVSYPDGVVYWSPVFGDRRVDFKALLEERVGPNVLVDNDANLATVAERWFGHGRDVDNFVVITVEHGVGMGMYANARLVRGMRGFSGEFGHTKIQLDGALCRCGQRGCVEAYVADYAIARDAAVFGSTADLDDPSALQVTVEALVERARAGDEAAGALFDRAGQRLGAAIANIVNIFNPPLVIISGARAAHADSVFFRSMERALERFQLISDLQQPRIEVHGWGDDVWARGAAALVLEAHVAQ